MTDWKTAPALVNYATEQEYRGHYLRNYCAKGVEVWTFDKTRVFFPKHWFDHGFYENKNGVVDGRVFFNRSRAERIDWIKWTLENPNAELFQGWNNKKKAVDPFRRVAVVLSSYVVVIQMQPKGGSVIITAFPAVPETLDKIRHMPKWS